MDDTYDKTHVWRKTMNIKNHVYYFYVKNIT